MNAGKRLSFARRISTDLMAVDISAFAGEGRAARRSRHPDQAMM
jgi:hypothetical protein